MASPRRFSLNYNTETEKWELRNEQNSRLLGLTAEADEQHGRAHHAS